MVTNSSVIMQAQIQQTLRECDAIGGAHRCWLYKKTIKRNILDELIKKLEEQGFYVKTLCDKWAKERKHPKTGNGIFEYLAEHKCDDDCKIQLNITHPEREANHIITQIESDIIEKKFQIMHFSKDIMCRLLVKKLREKGYDVNIFYAQCYHRALCDSSSIKCAAKKIHDTDDLTCTYCSHRCCTKCEKGVFMKISLLPVIM